MTSEKFGKSMYREALQGIAEKTKELRNAYKDRKMLALDYLENIIEKSFKYVNKKIKLLDSIKRNLPIVCVVEDKSDYLIDFNYIKSELNRYIKESKLSRQLCLRS